MLHDEIFKTAEVRTSKIQTQIDGVSFGLFLSLPGILKGKSRDWDILHVVLFFLQAVRPETCGEKSTGINYLE